MDITAGSRVTCCVCGMECDAGVKAISYRSIDHLWWCADESACRERAAVRARTHTTTGEVTGDG